MTRAFPRSQTRDDNGCLGMSLRDYFAARALTMRFGRRGSTASIEDVADCCYQMADAMMKRRRRKPDPLVAQFRRMLDAAHSSGIPDWYLTLSTELEHLE